MASLVGITCFTTTNSNVFSNFHVASLRRNLPTSSNLWSPTSSPCRRTCLFAPFATGHEADLWASVQPQIWFLLPPLIVVASNSAWQRGGIPFENLARLFASMPHRQEIERSLVHITVVLLVATAFKSNISAPNPYDTYENVPPDISDQQVRKRIQKPKSPQAERCTQKCVGTCIRGGAGSPGEGPFNVRKPLVVFKEGFRTRQYCLVECSEICNLIGDGQDGP